MRFCVIGGMNLDVIGRIGGDMRPGDSNIGRIRFSAGGVGMNIARTLAGMGHEVCLLSVLSRDLFGRFLEEECVHAGIDMGQCVRTSLPTPCYMAAHREDGEMELAINDMAALECLAPEAIRERADYINSFDAAVIEANLSEGALRAVADIVKKPLIADAVSGAKCAKLKGVLPRLDALKLNFLEAQTLTGKKTASDAGKALILCGVKRVLVSLGMKGVYACGEAEEAHLAPSRVYSCDTNGAGDAMCAGLAEGTLMGLDAVKCAARGMDAAQKLLSAREK